MKLSAVAILFLSVASAGAAQDSLSAAKDLYAAAAYEEALSTLARLSAAPNEAAASTRSTSTARSVSSPSDGPPKRSRSPKPC